MIWQTVHGIVPSKSNNYIPIGNKLIKNEKVKDYEKTFILQCGTYKNKNIQGKFEFYANIYFPTESHDLDGSLKIVLDCLQKAKAIKNDNKCIKITIQKFVDNIEPRIEFAINEL